eukprot:Awhi_evm1s14027
MIERATSKRVNLKPSPVSIGTEFDEVSVSSVSPLLATESSSSIGHEIPFIPSPNVGSPVNSPVFHSSSPKLADEFAPVT